MSDDPTEHAQEHIHHEATHGGGPKWIMWAALTAAFLAALAAVSSSLASKHLTQATLTRIDSNDKWLEYDSDSVKRSNIYTRDENWALTPAERQAAIAKQHDDDQKKKAEYATPVDQEKNLEKPQGMLGFQALAKRREAESAEHLETHETYETSATMFHIAIAIVAIAVVAKRKEFWYVSMVGGVVGLLYFGSAFAHAPKEQHPLEQATEHVATGSVPATERH